MAYQETTKTSYGSRVKNSFKGILSGILLIIIGTVLLWWNEGRAVKTSKMLHQAERAAVHVESVAALDPSLEGKLIHATAMAQTGETLSDPTFGVKVNGIALSRDVEFYQWEEHASSVTKDKIGGGQETVTTYEYDKGWSRNPVDSRSFKDPEYQGLNFVLMNVEDKDTYASDVQFGAYQLPSSMINSFYCNEAVKVSPSDALVMEWNNDINALRRSKNGGYGAYEDIFKNNVFVDGNVIYLGANPDAPEIGDVRVTFKYCPNQTASVLAQVAGNTFTSFTAKNGKSLQAITMGEVSMDDMFTAREKSNKAMLWLFRILGILLVIGGFRGIVDFVVTLLKVVPFLANIANLGVKAVCAVVGFVWSLIVIIIAWIAYRPVVALLLIAAIVAVVYLSASKGKTVAA